ncbi:MAG: putative Ig domain-containing protein [Deltaproteobacteria bacterium]|nr:putative Ig domain-containing protein [Deltaproteobacteria bacterium]
MLNMVPVKKKFIVCFFLLFLGGLLAGCKGKEARPPSPDSTATINTEHESAAEPDPILSDDSLSSGNTYEEEKEDVPHEEEIGPENSPPEITALELTPSVLYPGVKVKVDVSAVDDEDDEIYYYYRWQKNKKFLPRETGEELDTVGFKRGDFVTAFVTPYDEEGKGDERMSPSLLILNRPPEITSSPLGKFSDGIFTYQVEVTDPEGDDLTFSLEKFPPAMIIDPSSGLIEWKVPENGQGTVAVKVVVSDGNASAFQVFNLDYGR